MNMKNTRQEGYTNIRLNVDVKNSLAEIAGKHGASIALLVESILYIDNAIIDNAIIAAKDKRQSAKRLAKKLKSLSAEELQRLLNSSSSS